MSNTVRSLARAREKQEAKSATLAATLGALMQSGGGLSQLMAQPIPIRTSFQIGKIVKAVGSELEQYEASRKTLCERYTNKDEDGKPIMVNAEGNPLAEGETSGQYDIPKDKMETLQKELLDLQSVEVQIPGQQIKVGDLGSINIAPALLMSMDWIITE